MVSLNQHRRHLSLEERAFAAAEAAKYEHGTNQYRDRKKEVGPIDPTSNPSPLTIDAAAAKMHISPKSAKRAKTILADGTPDDKKDVLTGKASLAKKAEEVGKRKRAAKAEKDKAAARRVPQSNAAAGLQRRFKPVKEVADEAGLVWTEAEIRLWRELKALEDQVGQAKGARGQFRGKPPGGAPSGPAIVEAPDKQVPTRLELGLGGAAGEKRVARAKRLAEVAGAKLPIGN